MRLSLDDFEVLAAVWQQRAAAGDETTLRVAQALDMVLQLRRAQAGVRARPRALRPVAVATCRRGLQAVARRCWAGMNAPLTLRWARSGGFTLTGQL